MKRIATLNLTLTLLSLSHVLNNYLPNQPHGVQVLFEEKMLGLGLVIVVVIFMLPQCVTSEILLLFHRHKRTKSMTILLNF